MFVGNSTVLVRKTSSCFCNTLQYLHLPTFSLSQYIYSHELATSFSRQVSKAVVQKSSRATRTLKRRNTLDDNPKHFIPGRYPTCLGKPKNSATAPRLSVSMTLRCFIQNILGLGASYFPLLFSYIYSSLRTYLQYGNKVELFNISTLFYIATLLTVHTYQIPSNYWIETQGELRHPKLGHHLTLADSQHRYDQ